MSAHDLVIIFPGIVCMVIICMGCMGQVLEFGEACALFHGFLMLLLAGADVQGLAIIMDP
jgi:hypothetical protein